MNELGAEVVVYKTPATPEQLQLQVEIESLNAKLANATDAEKPEIESAIAEKQAELDKIS